MWAKPHSGAAPSTKAADIRNGDAFPPLSTTSGDFPQPTPLDTSSVRVGDANIGPVGSTKSSFVQSQVVPSSGGRGRVRGGRGGGRKAVSSSTVVSAVAAGGLDSATGGGSVSGSSSLEEKLVALTTQVAELLQEIRILRQENEALRRQVSRGVQQHHPYALQPIPTPAFSPVHPLPPPRTRVSGDLSPPLMV